MKIWIILLFPALCLGELSADLNGDGTVNFADLAIMMDEWLMSDYYLHCGADRYVTVADSAVLEISHDESWSISFWVKGNTPATARGIIVKPEFVKDWGVKTEATGAISFNAQTQIASPFSVSTDTTALSGEWTHVVFVRDAFNTWTPYVNGVAGTAVTDTLTTDLAGNQKLYLGAWASESVLGAITISSYFIGYLDDIRIYKGVALTAAQVADIYYCGSGWKVNETEFAVITSNGWYSDCDDGSGTTLTGRLLTAGTWSAHNGALTDAGLWAAGGVPFNTIALDSEFKEHTRYINRTSKAIQFRFRSKDDFQVREYKILNPHVESNR